MTKQPIDENEPSFDIENRGGTLLVKVDGGKHQLFGLKFSKLLDELVDSAENDPEIQWMKNPISWDEVKDSIIKEVNAMLRST